MTDCNRDQLSRLLDGDLTLPERIAVEQHVEACAPCRGELEDLRRMDVVLTSWGTQRTPIATSTERRIARTVDARRRRSPLFRLSKVAPPALGTTIAALLVLLSLNLGALYRAQTAQQDHSSQREVSQAILKQSAPYTYARRSTAVLGAHPGSQASSVSRRRFQLDVN